MSVFEGIEPEVVIAEDEAAERKVAAAFIRRALEVHIAPREIAIFVRSPDQLPRARDIAAAAGLPFRMATISRDDEDKALFGIMYLVKGLEFRAVAVVACDESVLPLAARVADVADAFELDEVIATERQLLYVAASRARDRLWLSGVSPGSECLEEL